MNGIRISTYRDLILWQTSFYPDRETEDGGARLQACCMVGIFCVIPTEDFSPSGGTCCLPGWVRCSSEQQVLRLRAACSSNSQRSAQDDTLRGTDVYGHVSSAVHP